MQGSRSGQTGAGGMVQYLQAKGNVPMRMLPCPSARSDRILPLSALARELKGSLPPTAPVPVVDAFMDNIATCLALGFPVWLGSQIVSIVLGKEPVPSFAPPCLQVGPVVNGHDITAPGHLTGGGGLIVPRIPLLSA